MRIHTVVLACGLIGFPLFAAEREHEKTSVKFVVPQRDVLPPEAPIGLEGVLGWGEKGLTLTTQSGKTYLVSLPDYKELTEKERKEAEKLHRLAHSLQKQEVRVNGTQTSNLLKITSLEAHKRSKGYLIMAPDRETRNQLAEWLSEDAKEQPEMGLKIHSIRGDMYQFEITTDLSEDQVEERIFKRYSKQILRHLAMP